MIPLLILCFVSGFLLSKYWSQLKEAFEGLLDRGMEEEIVRQAKDMDFPDHFVRVEMDYESLWKLSEYFGLRKWVVKDKVVCFESRIPAVFWAKLEEE